MTDEWDSYVKEHAQTPATVGMLAAMFEEFKSALLDRDKKINELLVRTKELEQRPLPEHVGAWGEAKAYKPQQMVQHGGSCWVALRETGAKPGESDAWRLVAKAGRDAR